MNLSSTPVAATIARTTVLTVAIVVVGGCGGPAASPDRPAGEPPAISALPEPTAPTPAPLAGIELDPPAPSPSTSPPPPTPSSAPSPPVRRPFAMDLYRRGDFVSQATTAWCVPAAILTMANVVERGRARGLPTQRRLDRISRSLSSPRLVGVGSEPEGWAGTLDRLGYGPYAVVAKAGRQEALRAAARAIRRTGRPVGLLVWRGAHAWVMTGFEATADPALADDFRVTAVRVSDPWYPRPIGAWGRTLGPDTRVGLARLADVYLRWRRPVVRYAELDGRFVLVLPTRRGGG